MLVHEHYPRDFRVRREARALLEAGWAVDVVALRRPGEPVRERIDGAEVYRFPISRHRGAPIPVYLLEYAAFCSAACTWLMARAGLYDIVHVHAPPDWLVFAAAVPRLRVPVILDIHDLTPELYRSRFGGRGGMMADNVLRLSEASACRFASSVITVTYAFRDLLVQRGADARKIHVIHNYPDPDLFMRKKARKRKGPVIVHHGTLVRRYGPDVLVEAFRIALPELPGTAELHIYGDGDARSHIERVVERRGLSGRVFLHGEVEQERIAQALSTADICVVPNLRDDFTDLLLPTKLMEALWLGVATVASDTTVIRKEAGDGAWLVEPGNAHSLALALVELGNSSELRPLERAKGSTGGRRKRNS